MQSPIINKEDNSNNELMQSPIIKEEDLVVAICSTTQSTLKYEDVVSSLLCEEMRRKSMDGHSTDALFVRGRTQDRKPGKPSGWRSKSTGRSKSPGKSLRK